MAHKRHGRRGHRKKGKKSSSKLTDGQKHFLKETGEVHPSELKESTLKYTQIKDEGKGIKQPRPAESSSESEEEENPFQQLMSSIGQNTDKFESSEEDEEIEDEEEEIEDEEEEIPDEGVAEENLNGDVTDDDGVSEDGEVQDDDGDIAEVNDGQSVDDDDDEEMEDEETESLLNSDNDDGDDDVSGEKDDSDEVISRSESKLESNKKNISIKSPKGEGTIKTIEEKGTKRKLEDDSDGDENDDLDKDEDNTEDNADPFAAHFEHDLDDDVADQCLKGSWEKKETKIPHLGQTFVSSRNWRLQPKPEKHTSLLESRVRQSLCEQVSEVNRSMCNAELTRNESLTPLQKGLFSVINSYQDVYYTDRSHHNGEEIRLLYCLHALNHVLKTRKKVMTHNSNIKLKKGKSDTDDYRDQGLTRPKVLMVLPFRESATKVVNIMSSLLGPAEQVVVSNKKRFKSEFGAEENQNYRRGLKPEDFESTFSGNHDDHFRLGIAVSKRSVKMYVPFYQADIILASPLGLRTVIGADGEKDRDFDFLSSIELLVMDQTDVFRMQNWDHVLHILRHLHLQPKESHGCDFSRVRMWTLNGWSHLYRQTLLFSAVASPDINAIFNKHCHNYAGKVQNVRNPGNGIICQIITQTPQTFQRLSCTSFGQLADARFDYFIKKIVPHHRESVMNRTLVYIPSYFDFVRIRNYFKKEDFNFVHMNEYASDKGISRVRCDFFHGKAQFLLYTERLHFYRRFQVRGLRHIVFYELPTYPHFYSEMCNMMKDPKRGTESAAATCTVLYSKYDAQKLAEVVGTKRASVMLNSDKAVHMFVTGQES